MQRSRFLYFLLVGYAVVSVSPSALSSTTSSHFTIVATDLNNPRKLSLGPDGSVYVAEAGIGGHTKCFGTGTRAVCVGRSGSITRVVAGVQQRMVTGLVSWANRAKQRALGPAVALIRDGSYLVLLDDDTVQPDGTNLLGAAGAMAGKLVAVDPGRPTPKVLADFAAFEAKDNPDHGAGPGSRFGNPSIDSDPYDMVAYRNGFAVVDAGANDLLWVSPKGRISVLAVFPLQTVKLTKTAAERIGAPPTMRSIAVQSVPSCVAVGPDGALYVGELTARPFAPGAARIWRVVPGKKPVLYASGFTNISDLAFDKKDLLVLEIAHRGLYDPKSTGALIRLAPNGKRTLLASAGLVSPTGLAVGRGSIFISNYGVFPGEGPGPHGELVRLPAP